MNLRKVKKSDLYPLLDEIHYICKDKNINILENITSEYYKCTYNCEFLFAVVNKPNCFKTNNKILKGFFETYLGYKQVILKEFPVHYPENVKDFYLAEVVAYYVSTERQNSLPINDDRTLAKFLIKNKENILYNLNNI